jgi:hypothetical protein
MNRAYRITGVYRISQEHTGYEWSIQDVPVAYRTRLEHTGRYWSIKDITRT